MRIGLVCPYSLDVPGGVQNHVLDLAAVLHSRGHDVAVLAPGEEHDDLPDHVTTLGRAVPIPYNGSVARVSLGPRVAAKTRRWLRQGRFDLIHVHEPTTPSVALLALWQSEVPVVATFHTATDRSRAMSSVGAVLRPSMEKIAARVAVSDTARQTLVRHLGGEPVVIPNGIFVSDFRLAQPRPDWAEPGPAIGFLGRGDEPRKGLRVLLDAMPRIQQAHPDARLLVAGGGTTHPAELGRLSAADRSGFLSSLTVFVAPQTEGESFGIVLLEAMAAGAAVVASDLPAFADLLAKGRLGELFSVGDPADLAAAVTRLLSDETRRQDVCAQSLEAAQDYDWSRIVLDVEAVYAAVLSAANGGRS